MKEPRWFFALSPSTRRALGRRNRAVAMTIEIAVFALIAAAIA